MIIAINLQTSLVWRTFPVVNPPVATVYKVVPPGYACCFENHLYEPIGYLLN